jgi:SAM-dependent methyltransferase
VSELYDALGVGYSGYRRPDPRVAAVIHAALADASTVLNVGAGAGSYEPADRTVLAVEPSWTMIAQRAPGRAPVVQASAGTLPFRDASFAATLAILTVHHWPDRAGGLAELRRVARERVVVVTWDPEARTPFWLVDDYFPDLIAIDRQIFPTVDDFTRALGPVEMRTIPIPHDCVDGFLGAYWRRPQTYLDDAARTAISTFSKISDPGPGLARLRRDLADGTWMRRHGAVLARRELDLGYRVVVAARRR